jgi:flavin reductase (DIM6/NTAB) family NADH-FMN oxidoreductase RutF
VGALEIFKNMTKRLLLPSDPNFLSDIPWHVAIVTTRSKDGKKDDVCPVGAWGRINGDPPLYYVSIAQRDIHTAPNFSDIKLGSVIPHTPAPPQKPNEVYWKRHTSIDLEETKEFVLNIPHSGLNIYSIIIYIYLLIITRTMCGVLLLF